MIEEIPTASFTWAGQTVNQVALQAGQASTLNMQACFCKPGVYNLGKLQVTARPKESYAQGTLDLAVQKPMGHSLIIIKDTAEASGN